MNSTQSTADTIIEVLFKEFDEIRYVAIYKNDELVFQQRGETENTSSGETDTYEELLVNPTLLKLASQRGNIDCGGLNHLIVGYGNFHQLVKPIPKGHISICLQPSSDLNHLPTQIFTFLKAQFEDALFKA
ncbi:MAG: hypothetical protein AAGL34_05640 [Bacteroidota bacterium]